MYTDRATRFAQHVVIMRFGARRAIFPVRPVWADWLHRGRIRRTFRDFFPMVEQGRILAVDPGSRRIGLALSDERRTLASPLATIERRGQDPVEMVMSRAFELGVSLIVVGLPLRLDGRVGPEALRSRRFADELERRSGIEVVLLDERFTTVSAERRLREAGVRGRRRGAIRDQAAAAVLLQGYLDGLEPATSID